MHPDHEVAVGGGGFSGIGAAIALTKAGIEEFVVIEEGDGVGGAWHWNTYPGVGVDIPSFSYQFSYEQRADWSRTYAPGTELKGYAESLVDDYGLRPRLRLNTRITGARFDEEHDLCRLATADGEELTARHVVGATGVLTQPKPPAIAGLEEFQGETVHTARWDHALELGGKRVAARSSSIQALARMRSAAKRESSSARRASSSPVLGRRRARMSSSMSAVGAAMPSRPRRTTGTSCSASAARRRSTSLRSTGGALSGRCRTTR